MKRMLALAAVGLVLVWLPAGAAGTVKVVTDVDFLPSADHPNGKDRLDLYIPDGAARAPVIISFHGGGLREGDKSKQAYVGRRFASHGVVTAIANYRLSPAVAHPAHVEDAAAAVAWVKRNISAHGGDPDKIFVIGHSAGAYLAALLVLDPRYLAAHKLTPRDIRGAAPVSAFFYVDRKGVAPDRPKDTWGTDPATWKAASPAQYAGAGVPPLLLVYADGDDEWRRQQHEDFALALRKAGARDVETRLVIGRTHMSVWSKMADGEEETSRAILQFIEKRLKPSTN